HPLSGRRSAPRALRLQTRRILINGRCQRSAGIRSTEQYPLPAQQRSRSWTPALTVASPIWLAGWFPAILLSRGRTRTAIPTGTALGSPASPPPPPTTDRV